MEKIKELTQEEFNNFKRKRNKVKAFKDIVDAPKEGIYGIGDTAITFKNVKLLDVLKSNTNAKDTYYIVIGVLTKNAAMALSLYTI